MKLQLSILPLLLLIAGLLSVAISAAPQLVDSGPLFMSAATDSCDGPADCLLQQHASGSQTSCCDFPCDSTSSLQVGHTLPPLAVFPASPTHVRGSTSSLLPPHPNRRFKPPLTII